MSTFSTPQGGVCDLIWSKTSWTFATEVEGGPWIGAGGVINLSVSAVPLFDLRPYSGVQLHMFVAGITGGTTPTMGAELWAYDSADKTTAQPMQQIGDANDIPASGGSYIIQAGSFGAHAGAVGYAAQPGIASPFRLLFARINLRVNGDPTGITAPMRMHLYGFR